MALINWRGEEVKKEKDERLDMNILSSVNQKLGKSHAKNLTSPRKIGHIYHPIRTEGSMTFNLSSDRSS